MGPHITCLPRHPSLLSRAQSSALAPQGPTGPISSLSFILHPISARPWARNAHHSQNAPCRILTPCTTLPAFRASSRLVRPRETSPTREMPHLPFYHPLFNLFALSISPSLFFSFSLRTAPSRDLAKMTLERLLLRFMFFSPNFFDNSRPNVNTSVFIVAEIVWRRDYFNQRGVYQDPRDSSE